MFPLAVCQHVSPSLVPADNEWSFVVNFETVAIRFSTNSRQVMEEWVEVCVGLAMSNYLYNTKSNNLMQVRVCKMNSGTNLHMKRLQKTSPFFSM